MTNNRHSFFQPQARSQAIGPHSTLISDKLSIVGALAHNAISYFQKIGRESDPRETSEHPPNSPLLSHALCSGCMNFSCCVCYRTDGCRVPMIALMRLPAAALAVPATSPQEIGAPDDRPPCFAPKPTVLLMRMLKLIWAGPDRSLRGNRISPAEGDGSRTYEARTGAFWRQSR